MRGILVAGAFDQRSLLVLPVLLLALAARGQVAPASAPSTSERPVEKPFALKFRPVVLDSDTDSGTSLGLDYDLKAKYSFLANGKLGANSETFDPADFDKTFYSGQIDVAARGTVAASKEKNPNKLVDLSASLVAVANASVAYFKLGATFTFETDQSFDNKQHMFGITGSASRVKTLVAGDAGSIILGFGTVKPSSDDQRKALVGNLDSFKRWNLEASYEYPINSDALRSIEFDYRHYQETSAPSAIKAAGLDRNRLGLVRANLRNDFFLQYSRGSLPFDQRSARAVKIGWSLKFE